MSLKRNIVKSEEDRLKLTVEGNLPVIPGAAVTNEIIRQIRVAFAGALAQAVCKLKSRPVTTRWPA